MVDCGRVIKRMRPAPQGRGYRVRKRSNHVTIVVDSKNNQAIPGIKKAKVKNEAPLPAANAATEVKAAPAKKTTAKKKEATVKSKPATEKKPTKSTEKTKK